jgi:hypothetical protein
LINVSKNRSPSNNTGNNNNNYKNSANKSNTETVIWSRSAATSNKKYVLININWINEKKIICKDFLFGKINIKNLSVENNFKNKKFTLLLTVFCSRNSSSSSRVLNEILINISSIFLY